MKSGYHNELDRSQWGLIEARVASYHGYVFACWEDETPDFETHLGDLRFYLDDYCELPDGTHGAWEALGGILEAHRQLPHPDQAGRRMAIRKSSTV